MVDPDTKIHPRPRRSRRKPQSDQRFSAYLSFGFSATVCLGIFAACYALVLFGLCPLLNQASPLVTPTHRGEILQPVVHSAVESVKHHIPHLPGQMIAESVAGIVKRKIADMRKQQDVTDTSLMEKATEEFNLLRKRRDQKGARQANDESAAEPAQLAPGKRSGFLVLGMHRSGTSMLAGLMATGQGYNVGGPLIGGAFDNEKGFFELVDAVLQNDEFMQLQRIWWSSNVINYDHEKAIVAKRNGKVSFDHGEKALAFFNSPRNAPYLQKDPRMCITLKTWLPLLKSEPAVLFTYRHPLEVALSLKRREKNFTLEHGLRLWIVYNMRGVENSQQLCRVYSSNEAILADPLNEVNRISSELTSKCGIPPPPEQLTQEDVDKFVDPDLQHNKKKREADDEKKEIIAEHGTCTVRDYESSLPEGSPDYKRERTLYMTAMKIYCDFQNGSAYEETYQWPKLG
jgi:hypothetical protein